MNCSYTTSLFCGNCSFKSFFHFYLLTFFYLIFFSLTLYPDRAFAVGTPVSGGNTGHSQAAMDAAAQQAGGIPQWRVNVLIYKRVELVSPDIGPDGRRKHIKTELSGSEIQTAKDVISKFFREDLGRLTNGRQTAVDFDFVEIDTPATPTRGAFGVYEMTTVSTAIERDVCSDTDAFIAVWKNYGPDVNHNSQIEYINRGLNGYRTFGADGQTDVMSFTWDSINAMKLWDSRGPLVRHFASMMHSWFNRLCPAGSNCGPAYGTPDVYIAGADMYYSGAHGNFYDYSSISRFPNDFAARSLWDFSIPYGLTNPNNGFFRDLLDGRLLRSGLCRTNADCQVETRFTSGHCIRPHANLNARPRIAGSSNNGIKRCTGAGGQICQSGNDCPLGELCANLDNSSEFPWVLFGVCSGNAWCGVGIECQGLGDMCVGVQTENVTEGTGKCPFNEFLGTAGQQMGVKNPAWVKGGPASGVRPGPNKKCARVVLTYPESDGSNNFNVSGDDNLFKMEVTTNNTSGIDVVWFNNADGHYYESKRPVYPNHGWLPFHKHNPNVPVGNILLHPGENEIEIYAKDSETGEIIDRETVRVTLHPQLRIFLPDYQGKQNLHYMDASSHVRLEPVAGANQGIHLQPDYTQKFQVVVSRWAETYAGCNVEWINLKTGDSGQARGFDAYDPNLDDTRTFYEGKAQLVPGTQEVEMRITCTAPGGQVREDFRSVKVVTPPRVKIAQLQTPSMTYIDPPRQLTLPATDTGANVLYNIQHDPARGVGTHFFAYPMCDVLYEACLTDAIHDRTQLMLPFASLVPLEPTFETFWNFSDRAVVILVQILSGELKTLVLETITDRNLQEFIKIYIERYVLAGKKCAQAIAPGELVIKATPTGEMFMESRVQLKPGKQFVRCRAADPYVHQRYPNTSSYSTDFLDGISVLEITRCPLNPRAGDPPCIPTNGTSDTMNIPQVQIFDPAATKQVTTTSITIKVNAQKISGSPQWKRVNTGNVATGAMTASGGSWQASVPLLDGYNTITVTGNGAGGLVAEDERTVIKKASVNPPSQHDPIGFHDFSWCDQVFGWTCDQDDYSQAPTVELYVDGPRGNGGTRVATTTANTPRGDAASVCGGFTNRGYKFVPPASLKTGTNRVLYAYAIDPQDGSATLLSNSGTPQVYNCKPGANLKVLRSGLTAGSKANLNASVTANTSKAGNPAVWKEQAVGNYSVRATDKVGYTETAGTCEHSIGAPDCVIAAYNLATTCNGTDCSVSTTATDGKVRKVEFVYTAAPDPTKGRLRIQRTNVNGTLANIGTALATPGSAGAQSANAAEWASLTPGTFKARFSNFPRYKATAGMCSYSIGAAECNVSTFNLIPSCTSGKDCELSATVTAGKVTKVVVRYDIEALPVARSKTQCEVSGPRVVVIKEPFSVQWWNKAQGVNIASSGWSGPIEPMSHLGSGNIGQVGRWAGQLNVPSVGTASVTATPPSGGACNYQVSGQALPSGTAANCLDAAALVVRADASGGSGYGTPGEVSLAAYGVVNASSVTFEVFKLSDPADTRTYSANQVNGQHTWKATVPTAALSLTDYGLNVWLNGAVGQGTMCAASIFKK